MEGKGRERREEKGRGDKGKVGSTENGMKVYSLGYKSFKKEEETKAFSNEENERIFIKEMFS